MPDGSEMREYDIPEFSVGARYVIFVSSIPWTITPVWAGLAFEVWRPAGSSESYLLGPGLARRGRSRAGY
jgi:hypothetical protein